MSVDLGSRRTLDDLSLDGLVLGRRLQRHGLHAELSAKVPRVEPVLPGGAGRQPAEEVAPSAEREVLAP